MFPGEIGSRIGRNGSVSKEERLAGELDYLVAGKVGTTEHAATENYSPN